MLLHNSPERPFRNNKKLITIIINGTQAQFKHGVFQDNFFGAIGNDNRLFDKKNQLNVSALSFDILFTHNWSKN